MAIISPFRALRYDPERVPVQQVVTQPYDKITPAMQERYYQASPYNLVRIILGKRMPRRRRRRKRLHPGSCLIPGLAPDGNPEARSRSLHLPLFPDFPKFRAREARKPRGERRGFIALGRIEEYSADVVFRHEQTLAKPKADRLDLLRATRAHFGQIFMLYSGAGKVDALLDSAAVRRRTSRSPTNTASSIASGKFPMPAVIAAVQEQMRDQKLIIADGHHRYETALTYRNERRAGADTGTGLPAPYDSVMMTFVDMDESRASGDSADAPAGIRTAAFFAGTISGETPASSSMSKKSMPESTRRAPPRFCIRPDRREPRCWQSPPSALSCCTRRRPSALVG